ncbi:hypothetical protein [Nostoc sp.]|uniref:hypothetical protein n=1 Tax=Nostoc sp. TaxID=1180 RepID=UPI002FF627C2
MTAKLSAGHFKQSVLLTNETFLNLAFDSEQTVLAIQVDQQAELADAIEEIGLGGTDAKSKN